MQAIDHATYLYSSVVAAGTGSIYLFNLTNHIYNEPFTYLALPYFVVDFFFCKPSNKIHHVCVLSLVTTMLWDPHPAVSMYLYKMELSTLLFNALPYVPEQFKRPLMAGFIAAFTKVRVVEGYFFLKKIESELEGNPHIRVPLYALYAVNLYWFSLMLKKMWGRDRAKGPNYARLCQRIAAFSYLGAIPATAACLPVMCAHAFAGVTSFFYHGFKGAGRPSRAWFVLDSVAVHAVMAMNVWIAAREWLTLSLVINAYCLLVRIVEAEEHAIPMTSVSVLVDSAFILGADSSNLFKFDYLLHLYLICLVFYVDFFNDLTYLCFHVIMTFNAGLMVGQSECF